MDKLPSSRLMGKKMTKDSSKLVKITAVATRQLFKYELVNVASLYIIIAVGTELYE